MNQSSKLQAVVVGLFVAVAIAILAGAILTIGDLNDTFTRKMSVTAIFDDVGGLKQGDNVWFSGVKVGTVKKLAFHGESEVQVEMRIDTEAASYLHTDALAKIGSDGLIGNPLVVLYGGTPGAPTLVDGTLLATGTSVSVEEIMAVLQENSLNLRVITGRLARGEGTAGKLLADDALYTELMEATEALVVASKSARELTGSLALFTDKLNRKGYLPNDIVTDQTIWPAVLVGVDKLKHTSERAFELVDGLAGSAADPNTPVGVLLNDEAVAGDLKVTIDNLSESSALLAEDLEALQHTFPLKHFFKKKAKAEAKAAARAAE